MSERSTDASIDAVRALKKALASSLLKTRFHPSLRSASGRFGEGKASHLDKGSAKLIDTTISAHDILFRANTVFPFILFPDTVTIDREKLTIANRFFFRVAKITSVPIRDILSVEVDIGPFFGSVYMTSRYFFTNPHSINFLWRQDALTLQRILQGYIIANEQHMDCSKMEKEQLKVLLEDLGRGDTD